MDFVIAAPFDCEVSNRTRKLRTTSNSAIRARLSRVSLSGDSSFRRFAIEDPPCLYERNTSHWWRSTAAILRSWQGTLHMTREVAESGVAGLSKRLEELAMQSDQSLCQATSVFPRFVALLGALTGFSFRSVRTLPSS